MAIKKYFGIGEPGLGTFGKQFRGGVGELREIREEKIQPFLKERIWEPTLEGATFITEKFTVNAREAPREISCLSFIAGYR